jgi:hypothetical protein
VANTITAFLETLVAAAGDYNASPVGRLSYLDAVYKDIKPEAVRAGKTVQVYFPDLGAFTDIGNGAFTDENLNPSFVNLTFNQHPGKSFTVTDFEQWQTSVEIREKFIDPLYKRAAEYLNGQIAAQITAANFPTNAIINGGTFGEVLPTDAALAWDQLASAKCPVDDTENMRLLVHNNNYRRMLTDNAWTQENQVGAMQAEQARQRANVRKAFNAEVCWDQQAPKVNAVAVTGTSVGVTNASAAVTGTGTSFTTQLSVGQWLIFANDATATPYRILSITSNTALTLAANFTGTTNAATQATVTGWTALYAHKYAIGVALRPLPEPDTKVVEHMTVYVKDIPLRIMIGYQQRTPGYLVTCDFGYAIAVLRPAFGNIITC